MKKNNKQQRGAAILKTSGFNEEFDIEAISKDIDSLISKYYQGTPLNVLIEGQKVDKGFFLMFIKKDSTNPTNDLTVRTFGSNITIGQLLQAFEEILDNIAKNATTTKIPVV